MIVVTHLRMLCRSGLLLLALSCLTAAGPACAGQDDSHLAALLADAQTLRLASDPQWLALLHVNRGGTTRDRGRSYVDDPAFFLSARGGDDANAELEATIRVLFSADRKSVV